MGCKHSFGFCTEACQKKLENHCTTKTLKYQIIRYTFSHLLFLIEALLVTVWYAETSGIENVGDLEVAENAFNLSSAGTL